MSAPSTAPSKFRINVDVSALVTEDDKPVDSIYSEKQMRLLTEPLRVEWVGPYEDVKERWLRWCDAKGELLPTGAEHARRTSRGEAPCPRDRPRTGLNMAPDSVHLYKTAGHLQPFRASMGSVLGWACVDRC